MSSGSVDAAQPHSSHRSLVHLAIFTSLFIPLACIPYIPIRRHLLALKKSVHVLSQNTLSIQHELNTTLLQARLLKEEKLQLVDQLRDVQVQLDAVKAQAVRVENDKYLNEKFVSERFNIITQSAAQRENTRLKVEGDIRRQVDIIERRIDNDSEMLFDLSISLADVAAFMEEVEIQQGWSHLYPRDRGIHRMRQLALKMHSSTKARNPDEQETQ